MLELGMSFSLEQLVIDDDSINMMHQALRGFTVDHDALSFESIKNVGVGGDFFIQPETMASFDKVSNPMVFNRKLINAWQEAGSKDIAECAHEKVLELLEREVMPVDADAKKEMDKIVFGH